MNTIPNTTPLTEHNICTKPTLHVGIVRRFSKTHGYGFTTPDTRIRLGDDIFFHCSDIKSVGYTQFSDFRFITPNSRVSYEIGYNAKGEPVAKNVSVLCDKVGYF